MARKFTGTVSGAGGDYLLRSAVDVTDYPVTLAAWVNMTSVSAGFNDKLWFVTNTGAVAWIALSTNGLPQNFTIDYKTGAAGFKTVVSSNAFVLGVWTPVVCVWVSPTEFRIYVNGVKTASDPGASAFPAGMNATYIAKSNENGGFFEGLNGALDQVAVWNGVALTDDEVAAFSAGMSPLHIRPEALVSYLGLDGDSPEVDLIAGATYAITGAPTLADGAPTSLEFDGVSAMELAQLSGSPYANDPFTDPDATLLQNHIEPVAGSAWVRHPVYAVNSLQISGNQLVNSGAAGDRVYYAPGVPGSADYAAQCDLICTATPNGSEYFHLNARRDPTADDTYLLAYFSSDDKWHLYRTIGGTSTELTVAVAAGLAIGTYTMRLEVSTPDANTVHLVAKVNGVTIFTFDDTNAARIAAVGRGGMKCSLESGLKADNFLVEDLATSSPSSTTARLFGIADRVLLVRQNY